MITTALESSREDGHGYQVLLNILCGKRFLQPSDDYPLISDGNIHALREDFEQSM